MPQRRRDPGDLRHPVAEVLVFSTGSPLIADTAAAQLPAPHGDARAFARLVRRGTRDAVDARGLRAIERARTGRRRRRRAPAGEFTSTEELVTVARRRARTLARR
jgi:ferredoxin/flavodoxin---NADP+ reductase